MTKLMDLGKNGRLDWFFSEWVYGTQVPRYHFEYQLAPAGGGKVKLHMIVTQSEVDERFAMLVPVFAEFGKGMVRLGQVGIIGNTTRSFDVLLPSPDVSPRGRVAAKRGSVRRRGSSESGNHRIDTLQRPGSPSSPREFRFFCQRGTHHSPTTGPATHWSGMPSLSAAQSCTLQLPVHLAEQLQVRVARRQRYPDFAYRDTNLGPDLEQL
jgi:hypothetical protein